MIVHKCKFNIVYKWKQFVIYFCNMYDLDNNRYLPPSIVDKIIHQKGWTDLVKTEGYSSQNKPIVSFNMGSGPLKLLGWSQMHGNETTTTKALFDLIDTLQNTQQGEEMLKKVALKFIFQLNPDGAEDYMRVNAKGIDLNRDAQHKTQAEMQVLMDVYTAFSPDLCLNLHGQRSIFSSGDTHKPAALSFLAPAADERKSITPARIIAMQLICSMASQLPTSEEWGIGRYDDGFNINCTGDYFTAKGTPTILFEAGHFPNDYSRKSTRTLIATSIFNCIEAFCNNKFTRYAVDEYYTIPENGNHLRDIEISNVTIVNNLKITKSSLFVQFKEVLHNGKVEFQPEFVGIQPNYIGLNKMKMPSSQAKTPIDLSNSNEEILKSLIAHLDI